MQTAVEFLIENLGEYFPHEIGGINYLVEQAKEMEKQQIIDAYSQGDKDGYPDGSYITGEEYYAETYGSKGSDDINTLTSNPVDYQNHSNMSDNFKQFSLYEHKETITSSDTITYSQTEISDEEIDKILFHHSNEYAYGFRDAIKWYREQLKKK